MNISPVQYNSYFLRTQMCCRNRLPFGNGFKEPLSQRAIDLLGQNIIVVEFCSELNEVNSYVPIMTEYKEHNYPDGKSLQMFKLTDEKLIQFLEGRVQNPYYLYSYEGIGIAIGDKDKPINDWDKSYATLVCLVPRPDADAYKYKVAAGMIANGEL